jgi:hypothetical protein
LQFRINATSPAEGTFRVLTASSVHEKADNSNDAKKKKQINFQLLKNSLK